MTLLRHHHGHKGAEHQAEIREARRLLRDRVRTDWEYPLLPAYQKPASSGSTAEDADRRDEDAGVAGFRFHGADAERAKALGLEVEVREWRERSYSASESEGEDEDDVAVAAAGPAPEVEKKEKYRFEGPESVGDQIQERRARRRRKRAKALEEEVGWNEGLRHWMKQRDVWAGAKRNGEGEGVGGAAGAAQPEGASAAAANSPRSSTGSAASSSGPDHGGALSSAATTPDPGGAPAAHPAPPTAHPVPPTPEVSSLVPVASPILPTHPIRRRITPGLYSEIYSKIILQSRSPSVPINLQTLISALVQGWKEDGEWPPKATAAEPAIGKRRHRLSEAGFKQGVKAVGRVLGLTGGPGVVAGEEEK